MARLQILVNHYNEDRDVVRRLLSSLSIQTGVSFEVLVVSDGGGVTLTQDDISGYRFPIRYAYAPHSGVCHTRNMLMDSATADFVMFCDVDDCFHADGLKSLMAQADKADVVASPFLCENMDGSTRVMERDTLHVHGKVFRRSYLIENDIRFPDEMEFSGDMAFLWLAFALSKRTVWTKEAFFTWKWNPSSVTRSQPYFHVREYGVTLRCYTLLGRLLTERKMPKLLENLVCTTFAMIYVDVACDMWGSYPSDLREAAEDSMRAFLSEFWKVYASASDVMKVSRYKLMVDFLRVGGHVDSFGNMERRLASMLDDGVLIIGKGVVGSNLGRELSALNPVFRDKYKGVDERTTGTRYHVAFVCVDTPRTDETPCDVSEVLNAIDENDADVYVIKSTVPVGTTDEIAKETGKRVVFSPEYYGGTQHCNDFEFDFTILGGRVDDCVAGQQVLQRVYDARHKFRIVDARTAELAKYMENCWLATKVSFCCQFLDIAESQGVRYEDLRELFVLDPRVNPSHTFVYRDRPYWKSHCLDKDVPMVADTYDAQLIADVIRFNEAQMERYN